MTCGSRAGSPTAMTRPSPSDLGGWPSQSVSRPPEPSITGSKSYRCKDNKLIYIDWMSDGTARVKKTREEVGTTVTPGTDLKGDANAKSVTYNGQACNS